MINRSNYEQYFLDFHEAALDVATEKELSSFLEANPDLREEFESFIEVKIEPELNVFLSDKAGLHKGLITAQNHTTRLIAYLENDLDEFEKLSVEKYLGHNQDAIKELVILKKTKIQPEHNIVFESKAFLKKGKHLTQAQSSLR